MNRRCDKCEWYNGDTAEAEGECRKLLPTFNGWPVASADDWCGEFKPREEEQPKKKSSEPQYRLLDAGEQIQAGDEYSVGQMWHNCLAIGSWVQDNSTMKYRRPIVPTEQARDRWYLLEPGDVIQEGDECASDVVWMKSTWVGKPNECESLIYRRKATKCLGCGDKEELRKRAERAEAELAATTAERDSQYQENVDRIFAEQAASHRAEAAEVEIERLRQVIVRYEENEAIARDTISKYAKDEQEHQALIDKLAVVRKRLFSTPSKLCGAIEEMAQEIEQLRGRIEKDCCQHHTLADCIVTVQWAMFSGDTLKKNELITWRDDNGQWNRSSYTTPAAAAAELEGGATAAGMEDAGKQIKELQDQLAAAKAEVERLKHDAIVTNACYAKASTERDRAENEVERLKGELRAIHLKPPHALADCIAAVQGKMGDGYTLTKDALFSRTSKRWYRRDTPAAAAAELEGGAK